MTKLNDKIPKQVQMTDEEADALKQQLENNELSKQDIEIVKGLLAFNEWMHARLA